MKLQPEEDAYGREILAHWKGEEAFEIVEREDGYIDCSTEPESYFAEFADWPEQQKQAMGFVQGRVLDIGVGAGRASLYLQERGHAVLGIDVSPLALEVCRLRGLKNLRQMSISDISPELGTFDTILMFGNNFGLFGNLEDARELLKRFHQITSPTARIIAESNDLTQTKEPAHLAYQANNIERGRLPGQLRIRVRFKTYATPWFEYLIVSKPQMEMILEGTGWEVISYIDSPDGMMYVAVIEKTVDVRR